MSSLSSVRDPMYGTMRTNALISGAASKGSSSSTGSSGGVLGTITGLSSLQLEQVVGITAVAGTSLFVVKVALYAIRAGRKDVNDDDDDDDDDEDSRAAKVAKSTSLSILGFVRRMLRQLLLDDPEASRDEKDTYESGDGTIITHHGSCHCQSIQFKVVAPRCLFAKEGPGKIQYRHAQVRATSFRVYAGHECLKTYYVFHTSRNARKGAHAFCERCGVHILFAPSKSTPILHINVNCLQGNGISKIKISTKKDSISEGFPADGQWDTSDQLSTISEVTQPFHFQLAHTNYTEGEWKRYYSRKNSLDLYSVGENDRHGNEDEEEYDEDYSDSVPVKKVSVPPNPITPTTVSSSTIEADGSYSSQLAQLKMMVPTHRSGSDDLTNEDISLSDEASMSSNHRVMTSSHSIGPSTLRRKPPRLPPTTRSTASSPEMRNKMRYFMGKYQHHDSAGDKGSHFSDSTATTATNSAFAGLN